MVKILFKKGYCIDDPLLGWYKVEDLRKMVLNGTSI